MDEAAPMIYSAQKDNSAINLAETAKKLQKVQQMHGRHASAYQGPLPEQMIRSKKKTIMQPGSGPPQQYLLPRMQPKAKQGKKVLVIDLDETLVHSQFSYVPNADIVLSINVSNNPRSPNF